MSRGILLRSFSLAVLLPILGLCVLAQQPDCAGSSIPVGVLKANGEPIEGLTAADFTVEMKKLPIRIESAAYDSSARRILLVVDAGRQVPAEARKAELEFGSAMVSSAQPGDSLALIAARGAARDVKFGADRNAVLEALKSAVEEQKDSDKQRGVLDAVAEGISWLGEPRLGDAVVIMAMDLEGNHKTNYKGMVKMLEERHVRAFGVAFGPLLLDNPTLSNQGTGHEGFGYARPGAPIFADGDPNFFPLTINSGGYIVQENARLAHHEFKVTDAKKEELRKTAAMMSQLIDKVYAVRIPTSALSHSEPWTVALSRDKLQSMPGSHILYPHQLGGCAQSAAGR